MRVADLLPEWGAPRRAAAVIAHPDDESFGLGALLAALVDAGVEVVVVCLTRGEASTLGAVRDAGLGAVRDAELRAAAAALGVHEVVLLDYADGGLADVPGAELEDAVDAHVDGAELLVVFEPGGVTGHLDHQAATAAAQRVALRRRLPLVEWGVAPEVAAALRQELGAPFAALDGAGSVDVVVDRTRQRAAIACHPSQVAGNAVLARRLERQGDIERLRFRARPSSAGPADGLVEPQPGTPVPGPRQCTRGTSDAGP